MQVLCEREGIAAAEQILSQLRLKGYEVSRCTLGCRDTRYAAVVGLPRVIRSELVAEFATCEVDEFDSDGRAAALVAEVLGNFQARKAVGGGSEQSLKPDYEWAVSSGHVQIGRFSPFALRDELLLTQPGEKAELQVATPGRVNSLHWLRAPPPPGGRSEGR